MDCIVRLPLITAHATLYLISTQIRTSGMCQEGSCTEGRDVQVCSKCGIVEAAWHEGWPETDGYYWVWNGQADSTLNMAEIDSSGESFYSIGYERYQTREEFLTEYGWFAGPLTP